LASDTAAQANLARIQKLLEPLAADRDHPIAPQDLVRSTLRRLDAERKAPRGAAPVGRWFEVAVAASIGLVAFGLVTTGVNRIRSDAQRVACQNNLRTLSVGLNAYAETHHDQFPQVGPAPAPHAGDFPVLLGEAPVKSPESAFRCPAGVESPVGY